MPNNAGKSKFQTERTQDSRDPTRYRVSEGLAVSFASASGFQGSVNSNTDLPLPDNILLLRLQRTCETIVGLFLGYSTKRVGMKKACILLILTMVSCASLSADRVLGADRVPWTNSRVKGSPEPPKPYSVQRIYPNLKFRNPVELVPVPNSEWMLLLQVDGKVFVFDDDPSVPEAMLVADLKQHVLDFNRSLSIQPHPKFAENQQVFICYAESPVAKPDGTKLSRFRLELGDKPKLDLTSEEILLTWASGGHNGCSIRFDDQGLMFFSAGDGARPYPPDEYDVSQDLSDLRATICRIDVDRPSGGKLYSVPDDNPFVDLEDAHPEIWAYGFRNPWRFTIDPQTQQLLVGDVGWELWELVFNVERAGNYGWSIYEGPQPIRNDITPGPTPIRKPLVAYPHTEGLSVTGGVVYRGTELSDLEGTFLYGDYVTGLLWGLRFDGTKVTYNEVLAETGMPIISFNYGRDGEVQVMSYNGEIYKLVTNPNAKEESDFPHLLSETGLFASTKALEPSPGVYKYTIAAEAYQGGVTSEFAVAIPGEGTVVTNIRKRNWRFPVNSVFAKTISREVVVNGKPEVRRIETQLLHNDGLSWQPLCYVWNEDQTDAELIDAAGATSSFSILAGDGSGETLSWEWRHNSRAECRACHTNQTGGAVGFSYENLLDVTGVADAIDSQNAIEKLVDLKLLDKAAPKGWNVVSMAASSDTSQSLEARARSYLHANCAHCHCRGGGGTVALDVVYSNKNADINAIDFPATQGGFGLELGGNEVAKVIEPGNPYGSVLFYRMATSGKGHMPKLWTRDNDETGLKLIHDWIASLDPEVNKVAVAQSESIKSESNTTREGLRDFQRILDHPASDRIALAKASIEQADAVTAGLFERFLPKDQRIERLGNDVDVERILAMTGDAEAGRYRFLKSKVQQCRTCHRLEGQGQMVGPDLDGIAKKRNRIQLLESILDPAKQVEPEFQTHAVVTVDDAVITGLLIEKSPEEIVIRSADGKNHEIPTDDIEHQTQQAKSLMPSGLAAEMTAQELADLLAFLSELK